MTSILALLLFAACTGGDGDDYPPGPGTVLAGGAGAHVGSGGSGDGGDGGIRDDATLPVDGVVFDGEIHLDSGFGGSNVFGDAHP